MARKNKSTTGEAKTDVTQEQNSNIPMTDSNVNSEQNQNSQPSASNNDTENVVVTESLEKQKASAYAKIKAYAADWSKKAEFNEYSAMNDVAEKIDKEVKTYNSISETLCFNELKTADNIMLAAVKCYTFQIISATAKKDENGKFVMKVELKSRRIDPLRLHEKVNGGIGADKNWRYMVEQLNFRMTCSRALQLGIDPTSINGSYAMKDESAKISAFKTVIALTEEQKAILGKNEIVAFDYNAANETLLEDIQTIIDAMLGAGYKANQHMVAYLNSVYAKRDNKSTLTVGCANHKYMRSYLMDICHAAVTDTNFSISYKVKK